MLEIKNEAGTVCIKMDGWRLASLTWMGQEFLSRIQPPLFELKVRENGDFKTIAPDRNTSLVWEKRQQPDGQEWSFVYTGFSGLPGEKLCVTVLLFVPKKEPELFWSIEVGETKFQLERIDFPGIRVKDTLKAGEGSIAWPYNEGVLVKDMERREKSGWSYEEPSYPSKGSHSIFPGMVQSQYLIYSTGKADLYLGAHDPKRNPKVIDFFEEEGGIRLLMGVYPGVYPKEGYAMEYKTVWRFFQGGWEEGVWFYKEWFEKNLPDKISRLRDNPGLPDWYGESPVIITYPVRGHHDTDNMEPNGYFPYMQALPDIERLEKELDSRLLVLLMHWEGTAPWAPPFVWPPYGGEQALDTFIKELHRRGHLLGVYASGLGWTIQSRLVPEYQREEEFRENELGRFMCAPPRGEKMGSNICTAQRKGFDMCGATSYCQDTICQEAGQMFSHAIDYIQLLDQNHGGTTYFCYSQRHGHPPVPGKWQIDAMEKLFGRLQKSQGKTLIGCESASAEPFLPYLLLSDNRYELGFGFGQPIPMYTKIYHEYVNNFMGNQVCAADMIDCERTPMNLLYRIAYSFTAGDFLTLVLSDSGAIMWAWGVRSFENLPCREPVMELVRNANGWRRTWREYLIYGRGAKKFPYSCERGEILWMRDGAQLEVPPVLSGAYRNEEGAVGQFFVNFTPRDSTVRVKVPGEKVSYYGSQEKEKGILVYPVDGEVEFLVPGLSVALIEARV